MSKTLFARPADPAKRRPDGRLDTARRLGRRPGGRPLAPLIVLIGAFAGLGFWAARHGWLARAEGDAPPWRRLRDAAVIAVSAAFAFLYVVLTGGLDSPLTFGLYLPLVLAAICFGTRAGLASGLGMTILYVFGLGRHDPRHMMMHIDWEAALSFPLVAVFVSLISKRNEERLRALHSRARDLGHLLDMSQMMDSAIDLEMTLNLVLLNVQKLSGCQVCAVYLKDSAGDSLELRAVSGPRGRGPLRPALPCPGDGPDPPAFYAADTRRWKAGGTAQMLEIDPRARSFACLPLTSIEGLLGLLYVGYDLPDGLRPAEVERLEQLAARAAFPLQRVLMQQDFQTLAYTDAMTGLDNYRQFERTLRDELGRAERYTRPVSVLMLDIDHFKTFNDTLGHQAGDALLGQLGTTLRNALRTVDKPARYGGEEFAIVCPETGKEEARLIAERVRRAVADTTFFLTGQTARVTVSIGFATFPHDARTAADLIQHADAALYAAKHAGRDAVRGHDDIGTRARAA